MPYGTIKVDNITFTNGGVDTTITVSGLAASTTGDLTVTGTISGAIVRATTISGVTVTGTTVQGASGTFTSITGGVATITSGVFALGSAAAPSISFSDDPNNGIYSPGADQVAISTNGTGRLFIDSSGRLLVGTSSAPANYSVCVKTSSSGYNLLLHRGDAPGFGNDLGILGFSDNLGNTGAFVSAQRDGGTWTSGSSSPGRLVFSTTADGTNSPTERMRITSAGLVGIGTSTPGTNLDIVVGSGTATQKLGSSSVTGGSYLNLHGASASKTWFIGANYNFAGVLEFTQSTTNGGTTPSSTPAMVLSAAGLVGIGTSSPNRKLEVSDASADNFIRVNTTGATKSGIEFASGGTVYSQLYFNNVSPYDLSLLQQYTTGSLILGTNSTERARIDSSGRLLVGTSTARLYTSLGYARFQVEGTAFADSSIGLTNNQATVDGSYLVFNKTRGTTVGSVTSVQTGDLLGSIWFQGADGTSQIRGAAIEAAVDTTPGTSDMPGRLVFSTTADGASSPTERMRITNAGRVGIGQSSPATTFDLSGAYSTNVVSVAALNIDCSTGTYFTKTINGASTFTVSNVPASRSYAFTLEVNHTSGTITWFSGVEWPGGTAPTLTTGKTHLFMFVTDDGGSRWRAASLINYTT